MSLEHLNPPFSLSAETDALAKRFITLETGAAFSYGQTQEVIKINPQSERGRSITTSARAKVQREHHVVIECIRNAGFRRASDPEKIIIANGHIKKMRRTVKRGSKIVRATDVDKLNGDQRAHFTLTVSWFGALNQATRPVLAKRIAAVIEQSSDIKYGDILQLACKKR